MANSNDHKKAHDIANKIISLFHKNPGVFSANVLKLYWKTKDERDQYKRERDSLIKDVKQQRELLKDFSRFIHRKS